MKNILSVVLSLPSVLQNEVFNWLDLKDLGRLDSAVCNRTQRNALLSAWKDDLCIIKPSGNIVVKEHIAAWVGRRNIKISGAVIFPEFVADTDAGKAFFGATGKFLRIIKYPDNFENQPMVSAESIHSMRSIVERASACANLERFSVDGFNMKEVSLRPILTNCTKLNVLILLLADSVNFQEINECGQFIEYLHMAMCGEDIGPEDPDVGFKKTNTMKWLKCLAQAAYSDRERDRMTQFICSNVGLRELHVDNIDTRHVFWILESCTNLRSLQLNVRGRDNNLQVSDFPRLIKLTQHLRYLELTGLDLPENRLLPLLQGCTCLQALYLYNFGDTAGPGLMTKIHDDDYFEEGLPLSALHVCDITAPTLTDVLRTYPNLTNVGIARSTVESFDSALQVLHDYEVPEIHLKVPEAYTYTNIHLFNNLTALYLHECMGLTNDHLLKIAHNNVHLTTLYLHGAAITKDTLIDFVDTCQDLTDLHVIEEVYYQQDESFNATLESLCPSLVTIEVRLKDNNGQNEYF